MADWRSIRMIGAIVKDEVSRYILKELAKMDRSRHKEATGFTFFRGFFNFMYKNRKFIAVSAEFSPKRLCLAAFFNHN